VNHDHAARIDAVGGGPQQVLLIGIGNAYAAL
jgi:hypothetical protein